MVKSVASTKTKIKSVKVKIAPIVESDVVFAKSDTKKSLWQTIAWGRILVGLVVLVIFVGGVAWLFGGDGLVVDNVTDGQLSIEQQGLILDKISKHIKLPLTAYQIAVAVDPNQLKALSPFYDQVKSGDVVLVYENFALIYDEREDILVNATMLNQQ